MAGQKLRKEKSTPPNKGNNSDSDSAKITGNQAKDNEIQFLRVLSSVAVLALLILFAFYKYEVSRLEAQLKARDEQHIKELADRFISAGGDASIYFLMMDQFISLIYIIAIVVGVITWW
ncbi:hypothetical protein MFRU_049g00080 [Monilinia fructicola]|nr:hypothetical protein MFRU_049g00080 [Monilinia fructicola]